MSNQLEIVPVENEPSLAREARSNAIINVNRDEYANYLKKREEVLTKKKKEQLFEQRINNLETKIEQILQLLVEKK
jgi:hypothetical protein